MELTLNRLAKKASSLVASIPAHLMGTVTHVATSHPVAALTFDDGPHPVFTRQLLDILSRHKARATFFMIGQAAQQHPDLVQRVAAAGHAIGIHSWDHPSFPSIPGRERRRQILLCEQAVAPYGQKLFRPPYAHQSIASHLDALMLDYTVVTYSLHAFDWQARGAQWMKDRLISRLKPGSIILLHDALWEVFMDGAADRTEMLEALDMFLDSAGDRFRFVPVPELLQLGHARRRNWYVKDHNDW